MISTRYSCVFAVLLGLAANAIAQTPAPMDGQGTLTGQVNGKGGQGMPGVTVRLDGPGAAGKTATTSPDGRFVFDNLSTGTYTVTLGMNGRTIESPDRITVGSSGTNSVNLTFAETSTQTGSTGKLEVKASASTIQSESAQVSRAYETGLVRALPLFDRQHQELIGLMPGVTPPVMSQDRIEDPQGIRTFNVNGLPAYANAYFQDGSYQVEAFRGGPSRIAPNESVQQMNVLTSNYNGEYGFSGGSWTNTVTRPGTNGVHGSAFGLNTNRFFATRHPLNPTSETPGFNRNQFGGSIGAPIVVDKTFFFGAYEGMIRRGETLQLESVPTADFRNGNFGQLTGGSILNPLSGTANGAGRLPYPGGRIPVTAISPASLAILQQLPMPNQPGTANNLIGGAALREKNHRFDAKVDHRFSEHSTGFFRYGNTMSTVNRGSLLGLLGDGAQADLRHHNAVASITQSFTDHVAGEFRVGYSRYRNLIQPWGDASAFNQTLSGLGFANGLPQINIAGFGTFGLPGNYPSKPVNNTFDFATNWNWHNGMHHLKIGAQAIYLRADGFDAGPFSPRGTFYFGAGGTSSPTGINRTDQSGANAFASFLTGAPTVAGVANFPQTPTYRQGYVSGYITDTINLWQHVHLELGVRYDVFSPLQTRLAGGSVSYDNSTNQLTPSGSGGLDAFGNATYDLNNYAPRVGLVIQPFSRMAIRAGFGMQYFPVPISASALNQSILGTQLGVAGTFGVVPFAVPAVPSTVGTTAPNVPFNTGSLDAQTPYVQTYSLMVQTDLGNGFLLDLGYVGNTGRHLPFSRALNAAMPGSGLAGLPLTAFNRGAQTDYRSTGLNSNYNSAQVNLTKRFAAGLAIAGAYTYGKALDYGFQQANPFDTRSNYGPADWDRRHILAVSHMWRLPFGQGRRLAGSGPVAGILGNWELNGLLHWATGTPYSVTADSLACDCPGLFTQPAQFSGVTRMNGDANFDAAQFSLAPAGTIGSQSRNSFRGPELFSYDAALFKNFAVRENFRLELRAEAYNVTNTANYVNPQSMFGSPNFGRSIRTFNGVGGRQFQVGARLLF